MTGVPFAMEDDRYVPAPRYFDRGFFELERRRLWPRVWQMACREEELPNPGDFVEYEICDQSILLIRQPDGSVKGFHNACRHRATLLCSGSGRLGGGQIVCPFHGWRWNLDGSNAFVYGRDDFDDAIVCSEVLDLREVRVGTWGACVWITMDPDAPPLAEHLAPASDDLDHFGVEDLRVYWWKETIVEANWKIAQEAFHEAWHVMGTHPQLTMGVGDEYPYTNVEYTALPNGHGRFWGRFDKSAGGVAQGRSRDDFLERVSLLWQGLDGMTLERDVRIFEGQRTRVPEGDDYPSAAIEALVAYDLGAGIPIRTTPEAIRLWGGLVYIFPNLFFLPQFSNAVSYRFRPYGDDPERCRFEVWSLTMPPAGTPTRKVTSNGRFAGDDADNLGLIPRQDISNMQRQQRGLHSVGFEHHRLASEMECIISNMHRTLDRWLG